MAHLILLRPTSLTFGGAAPVLTVSRGSGGGNLVKMSPRQVWLDSVNDGSPAYLMIDLGSDQTIDTIALIGTNAAAAATWAIESSTSVQGAIWASWRLYPATLRAPTDIDDSRLWPVTWPALAWTDAPWVARYIRITLTQPAATAALQVGGVLVGKCFLPIWDKEWDSGRGYIDTGARTRLPDGGLAVVDGVAVPTFEFELGNLSPAELAALAAIVRDRRTTQPLLCVEDPAATAGLAERMHYCTFVSLDRFSRRSANRNRWALKVEDIL